MTNEKAGKNRPSRSQPAPLVPGGITRPFSRLRPQDALNDRVASTNSVGQFRRIFTTGFRQFRLPAPGATNQRGDCLDDSAGWNPSRHIRGHHANEGHLAVLRRTENDDPGAELLPDFIGERSNARPVHFRHLMGQHFDSSHFSRLGQDLIDPGTRGLNSKVPDLTLQFLDLRLEALQRRWYVLPGDLVLGLDKIEELFTGAEPFQCGRPSNGLQTSHSGGHAFLGDDLEYSDRPGGGDVGPAAELFAVSRHFDNSDLIHVFLAEQSDGAGLKGLVQLHDMGFNVDVLPDLLVNFLLDLPYLAGGQRRVVGEVEAKPVRLNQRPCLFDMGPQHALQCLMEQMRRGMVLHGLEAFLQINGSLHLVSRTHASGQHLDPVTDHGSSILSVGNAYAGSVFGHVSGVSHLSPGLRVERGRIQDNLAFLTGLDGVFFPVLYQDRTHGARYRDGVTVADKRCLPLETRFRNLLPNLGRVIVLTGPLALSFQRSVESLDIDGHAVLLDQIFYDFEGEATGVVKVEGFLAGQDSRSRRLDSLHPIVEIPQALAERLRKGFFLLLDDARHSISAGHQIRIGVLHDVRYGSGYPVNERFLDPQLLAVYHRPPEDFPQDITALVIARILAVRDHKGGSARMVRNNPHGDIVVRVCAVFYVADARDLVEQWPEQIGVVVRDLSLQNCGNPFESHACVNRGGR